MLVTIHGKYLSTSKGTKNGKDWVCSRLLVGADQVVSIFKLDLAAKQVKPLEDVTVNVNLFGENISCRAV